VSFYECVEIGDGKHAAQAALAATDHDIFQGTGLDVSVERADRTTEPGRRFGFAE
jgi:hypothetical protein